MNNQNINLLPSDIDSSCSEDHPEENQDIEKGEDIVKEKVDILCEKHKEVCNFFIPELNLFVCDKCKNDYDGFYILTLEDAVRMTIPEYITDSQRKFLYDSLRCSELEIREACNDISVCDSIEKTTTQGMVAWCKELCRLVRMYESSGLHSKLLAKFDEILKPRKKIIKAQTITQLKNDKSEPTFDLNAVQNLSGFLINESKIEELIKEGKNIHSKEFKNSRKRIRGKLSPTSKSFSEVETGHEKKTIKTKAKSPRSRENKDEHDYEPREWYNGDMISEDEFIDEFDDNGEVIGNGDTNLTFKKAMKDLKDVVELMKSSFEYTKSVVRELIKFLEKKHSPKFGKDTSEEIKDFCNLNGIWFLDMERRKQLTYVYYNNFVRFPAYDSLPSNIYGEIDCKFSAFPGSKYILNKISKVSEKKHKKIHNGVLGRLFKNTGVIIDLSISNLGYVISFDGNDYSLTIYNPLSALVKNNDGSNNSDIDDNNEDIDEKEGTKKKHHNKKGLSCSSIKIINCNQWSFTAVFNDILVIAPCYGSKIYKCRISELWNFIATVHENRERFDISNENGIPFEFLLSHHVISIHYIPEICSLWVGKDRCPTERTIAYVTSSNSLCVMDIQTMDWELYEYSINVSKSLLKNQKRKKGKKPKRENIFYCDELPGMINSEVCKRSKMISEKNDSSLYYLCSPFGVVDTGAEFCRQLIFVTAEEEPAVAKKAEMELKSEEEMETKDEKKKGIIGRSIPVSENIPILIAMSSDKEGTQSESKMNSLMNASSNQEVNSTSDEDSSDISSSSDNDSDEDSIYKTPCNLLTLSKPMIVIPRQKAELPGEITRYKRERSKEMIPKNDELKLESTSVRPYGLFGEPIIYRRGYGGLLPDNPGCISIAKWVWVTKEGAIVGKEFKQDASLGVKPTSYVSYARLWDNVWAIYDAASKAIVCASIDLAE